MTREEFIEASKRQAERPVKELKETHDIPVRKLKEVVEKLKRSY